MTGPRTGELAAIQSHTRAMGSATWVGIVTLVFFSRIVWKVKSTWGGAEWGAVEGVGGWGGRDGVHECAPWAAPVCPGFSTTQAHTRCTLQPCCSLARCPRPRPRTSSATVMTSGPARWYVLPSDSYVFRLFMMAAGRGGGGGRWVVGWGTALEGEVAGWGAALEGGVAGWGAALGR